MRKKKKVNANETYMQTVMRRFRAHHLAKISLVILVVVGLAALFAPVVAPYDPDAIVGTFSGAPCKEFILGTDQIGRDVFSRLLYATRISLLVGILATVISTVIGVVLGLIAGYFGGVADMILMRFTDMVMSFPYILLVLVAAAIFKPGLWSIILILGFVDWPGVARLVRGNVLVCVKQILSREMWWQGCRFVISYFQKFYQTQLHRSSYMQHLLWRSPCWMRRL